MRLIDIDKLIIKGWRIRKIKRANNRHIEIEYMMPGDIPIAYDIDKVIKQLEEMRAEIKAKHMCKSMDDECTKEDVAAYRAEFQILTKAIEIVKAGVNNGRS